MIEVRPGYFRTSWSMAAAAVIFDEEERVLLVQPRHCPVEAFRALGSALPRPPGTARRGWAWSSDATPGRQVVRAAWMRNSVCCAIKSGDKWCNLHYANQRCDLYELVGRT